jgi:formyltetrahydrofolate deformylase
MVSKEGHCLNDLLFQLEERFVAHRHSSAIVSNHREFYQFAASYNVPFHHIAVTAANQGAKPRPSSTEIIQSRRRRAGACWRRYMQILSDDLCRQPSAYGPSTFTTVLLAQL